MGAGFGYHLLKEDSVTFDVFGCLSHNRSDMMTGNTINIVKVIMAGESRHALTPNTRLKQKLSNYPQHANRGRVHRVRSSLVISLQNKYNSDIGSGVKRSDTVLLTELNVKL